MGRLPRFCGDCGSELVEGKKFCTECGAKVVGGPKKEGKKVRGGALKCESCGLAIDEDNDQLECLDCGKSFCETCESKIKKIHDFEGVPTDFEHPLCEVCYGKSFVEQLPSLELKARELKVEREKQRREDLRKKRKKREEPRPYTPDIEEAKDFDETLEKDKKRYSPHNGNYYFPEEKYEVYEPEEGRRRRGKEPAKKEDELDLIARELIDAIGEDDTNPFFSEDYDVDEDLDDFIRESEEELSRGRPRGKGAMDGKKKRRPIKDEPEAEWEHPRQEDKGRSPGAPGKGRIETGQWGPSIVEKRRRAVPRGPPPSESRRPPPYDTRSQGRPPPYDTRSQGRPPPYDVRSQGRPPPNIRGTPPVREGQPSGSHPPPKGGPVPGDRPVVKKKVMQKKVVKKVTKRSKPDDGSPGAGKEGPVEPIKEKKVVPVPPERGKSKSSQKRPTEKEPEDDVPIMEPMEEIPEMEPIEDEPEEVEKRKKGASGSKTKKK